MAERNLDFDRIIPRRNTGCLKYDFAVKRHMPEDILPLWVADMDFPTSSYVEDAVAERAKHPIFGYSEPMDPYYEALGMWMERRHGWKTKAEWTVITPGVVFALASAVKAYTEPGDPVLIQQPVYYPFSEVIEDNGRRIVSNTLYLGEDNRYHIDFGDFERKIVSEKIRLFLLCSPHNPVGRVWEREELLRLGEICVKHGVTVVSDEIHSDFAFARKHIPFASLKEEFADISVVCTSPSKTFNLAGLLVSNILIPNPALRRKFAKAVRAAGMSQLSPFGYVACEAAYRDGEEWYRALTAYLQKNIALTESFVKEKLPGVSMVTCEGTYLVWLDFRECGWPYEELDRKMIYEAGLWLDSGKIFGECGRGFQRINVACPEKILSEALERIAKLF